MPVTALRTNEKSRNEATYVAEMCSRPTRHTITDPSSQMMTIGQISLPHCTLRSDTVAGARNSSALTPKFEGFQRWRSCTRSTYLETIEIRLHRKYGQRNGERSRMPTLIPVMYALARCGQCP